MHEFDNTLMLRHAIDIPMCSVNVLNALFLMCFLMCSLYNAKGLQGNVSSNGMQGSSPCS